MNGHALFLVNPASPRQIAKRIAWERAEIAAGYTTIRRIPGRDLACMTVFAFPPALSPAPAVASDLVS